jgi:outer membrane protein assembly factor BamB
MPVRLLAGAGPEDEWPGWRGPRRDGVSLATGLLRSWPDGGPFLQWKAEGIGHGWSTVAVTGGSVYTTGDRAGQLWLTALDMNGKRRWEVSHCEAWTGPYPGSRATPTIDGDRLYLLSANGVVACRNVSDGSVVWERRLEEFGGKLPQWGYSASVLIHGDLAIVVPEEKKCVVALDKKTGQERWSTEGYAAWPEYCSPIAVGHPAGDFIVAGTKAGLVGVDAANGRVLWENRFSTGGGINAATPLYADSHVFWANGYKKQGVCLKIGADRSATQVWQTEADPATHLGDFIARDGHLYGHHGRAWKCLELTTGKEKWSSRALGTGALCYADGMLYLYQERGGVAALATCSPDGMEIRGRVKVEGEGESWAHPVVARGRLYLRYSTTLYCFDVRQPLPGISTPLPEQGPEEPANNTAAADGL